MPIRSVWFTKDNEAYLNQYKGDAKLNAVVNTLITHARLSDPDGSYLQALVRDYNLCLNKNEKNLA